MGQPEHHSGAESALATQNRITFLQWFSYHYQRSWLRLALETLNACASLLSVVVYVYDTYIPIDNTVRYTYFACSFSFAAEFILALLAAKNWFRHVFLSLSSYIDIISILYGFINFANLSDDSSKLAFTRVLRTIQVVRCLKGLSSIMLRATSKTVHPMELELQKTKINMVSTLVGVVFIAGCVFYELEEGTSHYVDNDTTLYLHQSIYWACVTVSTIGYGDYSPTTVAAQMLFPLIIIVILLVLPRAIGELSSINEAYTPDQRRKYHSSGPGRHVVLTGHVTPASVTTFVREFYHPDRGFQDLDVVILQDEPLDVDIRVIVQDEKWRKRITYLHGSPFRTDDLRRAHAGKARAVYIMANKYAQDAAAEDNGTLLTLLSMAQHMRSAAFTTSGKRRHGAGFKNRGEGLRSVRRPHLVVQFLLKETDDKARALLRTGLCHPPELGLLPMDVTPFTICIGHLRASLLGASLHTPGLIAFVSNLCISSSMRLRSHRFSEDQDISMLDDCWLAEYLQGAAVEVYDIAFPPTYWGWTFRDAALHLWHTEEVILFALHFRDHDDPMARLDVKLAPFDDNTPISEATVGYILSDDALVLGAGTHLKSAFDAHDYASQTSAFKAMSSKRASNVGQQQQRAAATGAAPATATATGAMGKREAADGSSKRQQAPDAVDALAVQLPMPPGADMPLQTAGSGTVNPLFSPGTARANEGAMATAGSLGSDAAHGLAASVPEALASESEPDVEAGRSRGAASRDSTVPPGHASRVNGPSDTIRASPFVAQMSRDSAVPLDHASRASGLWDTIRTSFSGGDPAAALQQQRTEGSSGARTLSQPAGRPSVEAASAGSRTASGGPSSAKHLHSKQLMGSMVGSQPAARTTRNLRGHGIKVNTPSRDLYAAAAMAGTNFRQLYSLGGTTMASSTADALQRLTLGPPKPRCVTTLLDGPPLDSPIMIIGSSCFQQLPQLIAAIRAAPPVGRHMGFSTCPIVIFDSDGKLSADDSQLTNIGAVPRAQARERIFVFAGSPCDDNALRRLHLASGCQVHALVLPALELLDEQAVHGNAPALADGQVLLALDALRNACMRAGCHLHVVSEVLTLANANYALPLCLAEGPYCHSGHAGEDNGLLHLEAFNALPGINNELDLQADMRDARQSCMACVGRCVGRVDVTKCLPSGFDQEDFLQRLLSSQPHLSPTLAPGNILMQTFMDSLFCQVIFDGLLTQILLKMLNCWELPEELLADAEPGLPGASSTSLQPMDSAAANAAASLDGGARFAAVVFSAAAQAGLGAAGSQYTEPLPTVQEAFERPSIPTNVDTPLSFAGNGGPVAEGTEQAAAATAAPLQATAPVPTPAPITGPGPARAEDEDVAAATAAGSTGADGGTGRRTPWRAAHIMCLSYKTLLNSLPGLLAKLEAVTAPSRATAVARARAEAAATRSGSGAGSVGMSRSLSRRLTLKRRAALSTVDVTCSNSVLTGPAGAPCFSFDVLFRVLVSEYSILPLGLYRRDDELAGQVSNYVNDWAAGKQRAGSMAAAAAAAGMPSGATAAGARMVTASGIPYVYTKPDAHATFLRETDDVYVLASPDVLSGL